MSRIDRKTSDLREWILLEAYKNGQARGDGICAAGASERARTERFFISRYAVYQKYFKLPIEAFFQGGPGGETRRRRSELRMKCSLALCESVRQLLKRGLIRFAERPVGDEDQPPPRPTAGTFIFLTPEGVREAETLLAAAGRPQPFLDRSGENPVLAAS
jgi:hypothetical protein